MEEKFRTATNIMILKERGSWGSDHQQHLHEKRMLERKLSMSEEATDTLESNLNMANEATARAEEGKNWIKLSMDGSIFKDCECDQVQRTCKRNMISDPYMRTGACYVQCVHSREREKNIAEEKWKDVRTKRREEGKEEKIFEWREQRLCWAKVNAIRKLFPKGTFNPDVIKTLQVLVSTYEAGQKKGKKGGKCKEKRQVESGILQLFENEERKWAEAVKYKRYKDAEEMRKNIKETEKLMVEINATFSHTDPVKKPPPYEKEVTFKDVYPQLPLLGQEGNYRIRDDNGQVVETGQMETLIKMFPDSKNKKDTVSLTTKLGQRMKRMKSDDVDEQNDLEDMVGYDPVVRRILAKAEKRGDKTWMEKYIGEDSSNEIKDGDSDGDCDSKDPCYSKGCFPTTSSPIIKEDKQKAG
ncbi:hypothetical protein PAMP_004320 [Pampus punctatissimus]